MKHAKLTSFTPYFLAGLAAVSVSGCVSKTNQNQTKYTGAAFNRLPASTEVPVYPLNPKFEAAMPEEDQLVSQIREGILSIQSKEAQAHGKLLRGTHSKGVCASADFEIMDLAQAGGTLPVARLKKGLFSAPGKYAAQVRFANADGAINPDNQKDVRGLSFSAQVPPELSNPQGLMDFAMNNATTFPIGNAQIFADLMAFAQDPMALASMKPLRSAAVVGAIGLGEVQKRQAGRLPYQKLQFWSTVPFALGDDEAVKYSLKPCADNMAEKLSEDPDSRIQEITRNITRDAKPTCFDFQVQLLEADKMKTHFIQKHPASYWVENADVEWPESQAPFYTIGRLTMRPNGMVDQESCERWRINVSANSSATHHGLGSINRARMSAEAASYKNRTK